MKNCRVETGEQQGHQSLTLTLKLGLNSNPNSYPNASDTQSRISYTHLENS